MYICIYVYMYIGIYVYMYMCICVYMYICIYVYMYICILLSYMSYKAQASHQTSMQVHAMIPVRGPLNTLKSTAPGPKRTNQ